MTLFLVCVFFLMRNYDYRSFLQPPSLIYQQTETLITLQWVVLQWLITFRFMIFISLLQKTPFYIVWLFKKKMFWPILLLVVWIIVIDLHQIYQWLFKFNCTFNHVICLFSRFCYNKFCEWMCWWGNHSTWDFPTLSWWNLKIFLIRCRLNEKHKI